MILAFIVLAITFTCCQSQPKKIHVNSPNNDWENPLVTGINKELSMSAWPWSAEQLEKATHTNELPENDFITVNIDLKQMGVGGNDTWSQKALPLNQYRILPGKYNYAFVLIPVK